MQNHVPKFRGELQLMSKKRFHFDVSLLQGNVEKFLTHKSQLTKQ